MAQMMFLQKINKLLTGLSCSLIILTIPQTVWAESPVLVNGNDLIEHARFYNGKEVIYQGEAIGDKMVRGDHCWINELGEDGIAVGIWLTDDQQRKINFLGRYETRGDLIKITGQFNQACPEHGGDMDIHASNVTLLESGYPINHELSVDRLIGAAILTLFAGLFAGLLIRKQFAKRHPFIQ